MENYYKQVVRKVVCDTEAETLPIIHQGFCLTSSIGEKVGRKTEWQDREHSGTDCTSRPNGSKSEIPITMTHKLSASSSGDRT